MSSICKLFNGSRTPVTWESESSVWEEQDYNALLYRIGNIFFHNFRDPHEFGNRIKGYFYSYMGSPVTDDSEWATQHIEDNYSKLYLASLQVLLEEESFLDDTLKFNFYQRFFKLLGMDLSDIGFEKLKDFFSRYCLRYPGIIYEALIPADDPERERHERIADAFADAVATEVARHSLSSYHLVGDWRHIISIGGPESKFRVEYSLKHNVPTLRVDVVDRFQEPDLPLGNPFPSRPLYFIHVDNMLGRYESDHLTPDMLNDLLLSLDEEIFSHREERFSDRVKRNYWEINGSPPGDPDWATHHLAKNAEFHNALEMCLKHEFVQLSDSVDGLNRNLGLMSNTQDIHLIDHLGLLLLAFIPHDAPNREVQEQLARNFAESVQKLLREKNLKLNELSEGTQSLRFIGNWRDSYREDPTRVVEFVSDCPNIPGHEFYTITTRIKKERSIDYDAMAEGNRDIVRGMMDELNAESPDVAKVKVLMASLDLSGAGNDTCVVCYEAPKEWAVVDCGHRSYCEECIKQIASCSICRGPITKSVKIIT